MGILSGAVKSSADNAHVSLVPAIGGPLTAAHTMTGAIFVTSNDKQTTHFQTYANFNFETGQHVEPQLLALLFNWTKSNGQSFVIPDNSRIYMYVYDSPCQLCTPKLKSATVNYRGANLTWKLGFSKYFIARKYGYSNVVAAHNAYGTMRWNYKKV